MMEKLNVLIIGSGHYATGVTVLSDVRQTDKDHGVLLPAVLALRSAGLVGEVGIAARDGQKLQGLRARLREWNNRFGWDDSIRLFPDGADVDDRAYLKALAEMPRPCVALIAVPDFLHREVMEKCIEAAIPFMVVKPAVTRLQDLYQLLDKLEQHPVLGMVDYHKVFDDANLMIREEYQAGEYGRMQHVMSLMTQRRDMLEIFGRWLNSKTPPNVNHYLGCHYIHMVGYITGAEPVDVRATAQTGIAAKLLGREDIADIIETQVRWRDKQGYIFSSYHVSGWNDPHETESMTYQELHFLCENGHIDSDQRYRGLRKVISDKGYQAPNPYFFNLTRTPAGDIGLDSKYGYNSVRTFIKSCLNVYNGKVQLHELDRLLPTLRESERVTAIIEAADHSLTAGSQVTTINRKNGKYVLEAH